MLDEGNVRLDEPWLSFVVPQSRARIERTDIIQRLLHRFDRPAKRFRNLFMLLELQRAKVLVDYRDCIVKQLCRGLAIAVFVQRELLLVIAQLIEQAFAKIAAANPRRIQLPDHFESFAQIGSIEIRHKCWTGRNRRCSASLVLCVCRWLSHRDCRGSCRCACNPPLLRLAHRSLPGCDSRDRDNLEKMSRSRFLRMDLSSRRRQVGSLRGWRGVLLRGG